MLRSAKNKKVAENIVDKVIRLIATNDRHGLEQFKNLIQENAGAIDLTFDGMHFLHIAALHGHLEILSYIVKELGIDTNLVTNKGLTAIEIAAKYGHLTIIKYLARSGALINPTDNFSILKSVLTLAIKSNHPTIVTYLFRTNNITEEIRKQIHLRIMAYKLSAKYGKTRIYDVLKSLDTPMEPIECLSLMIIAAQHGQIDFWKKITSATIQNKPLYKQAHIHKLVLYGHLPKAYKKLKPEQFSFLAAAKAKQLSMLKAIADFAGTSESELSQEDVVNARNANGDNALTLLLANTDAGDLSNEFEIIKYLVSEHGLSQCNSLSEARVLLDTQADDQYRTHINDLLAEGITSLDDLNNALSVYQKISDSIRVLDCVRSIGYRTQDFGLIVEHCQAELDNPKRIPEVLNHANDIMTELCLLGHHTADNDDLDWLNAAHPPSQLFKRALSGLTYLVQCNAKTIAASLDVIKNYLLEFAQGEIWSTTKIMPVDRVYLLLETIKPFRIKNSIGLSLLWEMLLPHVRAHGISVNIIEYLDLSSAIKTAAEESDWDKIDETWNRIKNDCFNKHSEALIDTAYSVATTSAAVANSTAATMARLAASSARMLTAASAATPTTKPSSSSSYARHTIASRNKSAGSVEKLDSRVSDPISHSSDSLAGSAPHLFFNSGAPGAKPAAFNPTISRSSARPAAARSTTDLVRSSSSPAPKRTNESEASAANKTPKKRG